MDHETPGGREIGRSFLEEVPGGKTLRGGGGSGECLFEGSAQGMSQCSQEGRGVLRLGFLGWRPRSRHLGKDFLTAPGSEAGVGHGGEGEAVAAGGGLQQQG